MNLLGSSVDKLSRVLESADVWEPIFEFQRVSTEETGLYPPTKDMSLNKPFTQGVETPV